MRLDSLLPDKKHLKLDQVFFHHEHSLVEVVVRSIANQACCPKCGCPSSRVHSRYSRRLADLPWQGLNVAIVWKTRRFFCILEECQQKIFAERLPQVAAVYARRTERLTLALRCIAQACGGESGARLADRLGMFVSPDTLLRQIRRSPVSEKATPRVLGVDDWAFRKGQRYGTVLIDLERGEPVDLLPNREAESLAQWLREHPGVEIISRDRGDFYIKGATAGAPHATQVADRFHLVKNLREAVTRLIERRMSHIRQVISQQHETDHGSEIDSSASAALTEPTKSTKSPAQQRRQQLYQSVMQLHEQGVSRREIARRLGIHRTTVGKFVSSDGFPERGVRRYSSTADPVIDYLKKRWKEGCQNIRQLTREIQQQGFDISYHSIRRRVSKWPANSAQKPTTSTSQRTLSSRQLSWLLLQDHDQFSEKDHSVKSAIVSKCSVINCGLKIATEFLELFKTGARERFDAWLKTAMQESVPVELRRFAAGIKRDAAAVLAGMTLPWSNGPVEGQVNRLKTLKRQMYGRGGFDLLKLRFLNPI